ncbi:SsrA-binding protein [Flavobacterium antarcticum]
MQELPAFFLSLNENDMFKILAKINKVLLPNYTKEQLDLGKATKLQKAIIAWKYFVTTRALG